MEGKKEQKCVNVAYELPCIGSSIEDIQFQDGGMFSKIRLSSYRKAFSKVGKLDIGVRVKIENWMSFMDSPCKLRMPCGQ